MIFGVDIGGFFSILIMIIIIIMVFNETEQAIKKQQAA